MLQITNAEVIVNPVCLCIALIVCSNTISKVSTSTFSGTYKTDEDGSYVD